MGIYRVVDHCIEAVKVEKGMNVPKWLKTLVITGQARYVILFDKYVFYIDNGRCTIAADEGDYIIKNGHKYSVLDGETFNNLYKEHSDEYGNEKPNNDKQSV